MFDCCAVLVVILANPTASSLIVGMLTNWTYCPLLLNESVLYFLLSVVGATLFSPLCSKPKSAESYWHSQKSTISWVRVHSFARRSEPLPLLNAEENTSILSRNLNARGHPSRAMISWISHPLTAPGKSSWTTPEPECPSRTMDRRAHVWAGSLTPTTTLWNLGVHRVWWTAARTLERVHSFARANPIPSIK